MKTRREILKVISVALAAPIAILSSRLGLAKVAGGDSTAAGRPEPLWVAENDAPPKAQEGIEEFEMELLSRLREWVPPADLGVQDLTWKALRNSSDGPDIVWVVATMTVPEFADKGSLTVRQSVSVALGAANAVDSISRTLPMVIRLDIDKARERRSRA